MCININKQMIAIKNEQKTYIDIYPKKAYRWPRDIWKILITANYSKNANQNYNELSLYNRQNDHHQKVYKQQMLERVWDKGNSTTLLLGI